MAGAPSCICCFGGSVSAGRVLGTRSHSKTPPKKWRALPPVFLALGGASPQTEYWLRNDAMPDASPPKKTSLKQKKTGVPPCPLYFVGCRKSGRVQAGSQRRRRSLDLEIPRHSGGSALCAYTYIYIYLYGKDRKARKRELVRSQRELGHRYTATCFQKWAISSERSARLLTR